jgi:hypothetical protein
MIPLASVADIEARLGRKLSPEEKLRAEGVLEDISGLVRDIVGRDFLNEAGTDLVGVPHTVLAVVRKAAERAMRNPEGYSGESTGDYSYQRRGVEDGVYLTEAEERLIRRALGRGGLWVQETTRGDELLTTGFVEDNYGCELFPLDVYRE